MKAVIKPSADPDGWMTDFRMCCIGSPNKLIIHNLVGDLAYVPIEWNMPIHDWQETKLCGLSVIQCDCVPENEIWVVGPDSKPIGSITNLLV